jgi:hypothetical protein
VIEGDGVFTLGDESFVDDVEHFEKRHVFVDVGGLVADDAALVGGVFLAPDVEDEFHDYARLRDEREKV